MAIYTKCLHLVFLYEKKLLEFLYTLYTLYIKSQRSQHPCVSKREHEGPSLHLLMESSLLVEPWTSHFERIISHPILVRLYCMYTIAITRTFWCHIETPL